MMFNKNRFMYYIFFFIGTIFWSHPWAQDEKSISINVMAYNIKNAYGGTTLDGIADVINEEDLDYVALQEVDSVNGRSSYNGERADEAAIFGELTGMNHEFARGIAFSGGAYGNAMLSELPFDNVVRIPLPGSEARVALFTDIDLSGGADPENATVTFISTHWMNGSSPDQLESAQIINKYIDDLIAGGTIDENWPIVLLGDLNAREGSPPINEMKAHWETGNFNYGIDWLFWRPADRWNWINSEKLPDPNNQLSDHEAVVSEMELLGAVVSIGPGNQEAAGGRRVVFSGAGTNIKLVQFGYFRNIEIYTVRGKNVRTLPVGGDRVVWDCEDNNGERVAGGMYVVHWIGDKKSRQSKVVMVK